MVVKALIFMFSFLLLSGCSTSSIGPIEAGEDSYLISKEQTVFSDKEDKLLASILSQANEYCLEKNRFMEVKHLNEYTGFFGNDTKTTLVFACLSQKEKEYEQLAPVVIVSPPAPAVEVPKTVAPVVVKEPEFPPSKLTNYAF